MDTNSQQTSGRQFPSLMLILLVFHGQRCSMFLNYSYPHNIILTKLCVCDGACVCRFVIFVVSNYLLILRCLILSKIVLWENKCFATWRLVLLVFITFSCFRVIDGWDTLNELEKQPVQEKTYRPLNEVRLQSVTIHANPMAE